MPTSLEVQKPSLPSPPTRGWTPAGVHNHAELLDPRLRGDDKMTRADTFYDAIKIISLVPACGEG